MNLVQRIFHGGLSLSADVSGRPGPADDYWYQPAGGVASSSGMRVSPETSKRLGTVIACVTARGRAIATLPVKVRTDLAGGGSRVVPNHPYYRILYSQPNVQQTSYDFRLMMQAHVDLRGNAYAEKLYDQWGRPTELRPMHPDFVTPEIIKDSGKLRYRYADPLTGATRVLLQEEVFHLRDWSDGSYIGQSRISMGRDMLGVALARQDYMARWLKNDSRTGIIFTGGAFQTPEMRKEWIADVRQSQTGENRGRPLLLPNGMTAEQLGVTPVDAQLLESAKASQVDICSLLGILPQFVGVESGKNSTYASMEQFNIMHAQMCVYPMVVMWEQAIQRDLMVNDRYYAKFNMAALLRGDSQTRFAGYNSAIASGWMCPDDARELEDMNPIPNGIGKRFWRSANLVPLEQVVTPKQLPGKQEQPQENPEEQAAARAVELHNLQMLATGTAERCVRKEVAAVRKLINASAGAYEITEFYAGHAQWIAEAFHMSAQTTLEVKIACDKRANELIAHMGDEDDEFHAAAQVWIDQVAATESAKLAELAVKGKTQ